jgi:hypothetical protein
LIEYGYRSDPVMILADLEKAGKDFEKFLAEKEK